MRLYHYATWSGAKTAEEGCLKPSSDYLEGGPPLVWLTENPVWEPCVRARLEHIEVEGPSSPSNYIHWGIPCWRFEVEVPRLHKLHYIVPGWIAMLKDGIALGSDIKQWHWITYEIGIARSTRIEK